MTVIKLKHLQHHKEEECPLQKTVCEYSGVYVFVDINIIKKNFELLISNWSLQHSIDYGCPSIGIVRSSYSQHLERNLSSHLKLVTEKVKVTNSIYLTSAKHIFPLKHYLYESIYTTLFDYST